MIPEEELITTIQGEELITTIPGEELITTIPGEGLITQDVALLLTTPDEEATSPTALKTTNLRIVPGKVVPARGLFGGSLLGYWCYACSSLLFSITKARAP